MDMIFSPLLLSVSGRSETETFPLPASDFGTWEKFTATLGVDNEDWLWRCFFLLPHFDSSCICVYRFLISFLSSCLLNSFLFLYCLLCYLFPFFFFCLLPSVFVLISVLLSFFIALLPFSLLPFSLFVLSSVLLRFFYFLRSFLTPSVLALYYLLFPLIQYLQFLFSSTEVRLGSLLQISVKSISETH